MLRSNSKSLGNHIVSSEEERERLQWEGFAEKEGFKSGKKRQEKYNAILSRVRVIRVRVGVSVVVDVKSDYTMQPQPAVRMSTFAAGCATDRL